MYPSIRQRKLFPLRCACWTNLVLTSQQSDLKKHIKCTIDTTVSASSETVIKDRKCEDISFRKRDTNHTCNFHVQVHWWRKHDKNVPFHCSQHRQNDTTNDTSIEMFLFLLSECLSQTKVNKFELSFCVQMCFHHRTLW